MLTYERVALVTGSSRGLGKAIARRLARDGLAVAINGWGDNSQAIEVAKAIRDNGGIADAFPADVTSEEQVARLVGEVTDGLGAIGRCLVLNATGPRPEAPVSEVTWQDHIAQLDFFVKSPVLLGRAVLPVCRSVASAGLSTSTPRSLTGHLPADPRPPASKGAQAALTRSWARELAPFGITVNTVAPGFIPVERHANVSAEVRDAYLATVPIGRMGLPDDIAHAVSFLASAGAGFVTGQRIIIDGGRSLG